MMYLCWRATYVERNKCRANGKYYVQLFSSQNLGFCHNLFISVNFKHNSVFGDFTAS